MSALLPGFADAVRDSQAVFRAVMDATARPGHLHAVAGPATPPAPLDRATAAVLLTLVDADTPLWLDDRAAAARPWLAFHCSAPVVPAAAAQFAVAIGDAPFVNLAPGTDEEPEQAATLVLQVAALGSGEALRLSGPGLADTQTLHVQGLPAGFIAFWETNGRRFPRGIDLILCAGDHLAALPRTARIG